MHVIFEPVLTPVITKFDELVASAPFLKMVQFVGVDSSRPDTPREWERGDSQCASVPTGGGPLAGHCSDTRDDRCVCSSSASRVLRCSWCSNYRSVWTSD